MDSHPLVAQLRFTRSEFARCLDGVSAEGAVRRLEPMNCISWIVGHLANQEHRYWVVWAQGQNLAPELQALAGYGQPASTPPLNEMWEVWHTVTGAADEFLNTVTPEGLMRNIYHYWYHTGEAHGIRQMLGHGELPQFVGDMSKAFYRPE